MKKYRFGILIFLGGIVLAVCQPREVHLNAFVGDGMMMPMLAIQEAYEVENPHIHIDYFFAGSGTLEETISTLRKGDLFMPGGRSYIDDLVEDDLILVSYPVAYHTPAIIVHKNNTVITGWDDLAQEGVRIAIPNPLLATSGKMAEEIINRAPETQRKAIEANISILTADVRESLQAVTDQQVDATLSWRSAIALSDSEKLIALEIPEDLQLAFEVWIAVPAYSTEEREARAFAEFVAGPAGRKIFEEFGFELIAE